MRITFPDAKCRQVMGSQPSLITAQLQPAPVLHTCLDTDLLYHLLNINSRITVTKQRKIFKQRKPNFLGHNFVHINRNFVSRLVSTMISEKIKKPYQTSTGTLSTSCDLIILFQNRHFKNIDLLF